MARGDERFVEHARGRGIDVQVSVLPDGTRTAADAAAAIGCTVAQIAKSIVLVADDRPVIAITSGDNRVDPTRVAAVLGAAKVRMAKADEARDATGYAIGGVPPFGHATPITALFDRDLLRFDVVYAAAGTPDAVFPIEAQRLAELSGATVADFRAE
jgi:prolyl-tRNA editing enzyme YbaK/EbsC (Cys-tRNA(Pro) deacylase)